MSIRAITFDVGATLLTPAIEESAVFVEEAARFGIALEPAAVQANMPRVYERYDELYEQDDSFWSDDERATAIWIDMYSYLCQLVGMTEHISDVARGVHRRYEAAASWRAFSDVVPVLDALQGLGVTMGLISNWDATLVPVMQGLGLAHYFETMISSADVGMRKPERCIFELALERLGVPASEAAHVGDHAYADAQGALGAGMHAVLLRREGPQAGWSDTNDLAGVPVIATLAELPTVLGLI
jgi:putative hydrolase of the HAD superfamily